MGDVAVNAPTVEEEEAAWTRMLEKFAGLPDVEVAWNSWQKGGF